MYKLLITLLLISPAAWAIKFTYTAPTTYTDSTAVDVNVRGTFYGECGNGTVELISNFVLDGVFNHAPLETGVQCTYWIITTSPLGPDSVSSNIVTRTD